MFNNKEKLRNQTCLVLKRCSSAPQTGTSMENQGRTTEQAITELALHLVYEELLEGVTGSVPGNRDDIDRIIDRKRTDNDFTVLLLQDTSRFTRAGQGHGQKLLYELRSAGILVYFAAEDLLVDDDMSEMYAGFLFAAARHAVKQLSYNATVGSTNSFLAQRSPCSHRPPFGLDRMYSDGGVDRHIIRNMPDGTQQQLDPATGALIRTFGRNEKKGVPAHYIKQKSEQIRLVPGDPKAVATVHLIFHLFFGEGLSYRAIARCLNDAGTPSPMGKEWYPNSVDNLAKNPIYLGRGIRNRITDAIYFKSAEGQPKPSNVTLKELAENSHVKKRRRPREEWLERPQPHLADFLPEHIRPLASKHVERYLDSIADGKDPVPNRDRHKNSAFILKGILRSKQGHYLITGRVRGKSGHEVRYYEVSRSKSVPKTNSELSGSVRAEPAEAAVLEVVCETLINRPGLEQKIKELVTAHRRQHDDDGRDRGQLEREVQRKQKQLALLSDDVSLDDDDPITRKVSALRAEIRALKIRLAEVETPCAPPAKDGAAAAAKLAKELAKFGQAPDPADIPHVQRMLRLLVGRMEADLRTKEIDLELSLPSWVGETLAHRGPVGLVELSACRPFNQTNPENRLILGVFHCGYKPTPEEKCFKCRRLPKAA